MSELRRNGCDCFTGRREYQYFPKSTDLSIHSQHDFDQAAYSLNTRPRQTLEWTTPLDKLAEALR